MTQAKLTSKVGCFKVRARRTERNDKVFIKRLQSSSAIDYRDKWVPAKTVLCYALHPRG